jgi:hypothetical protein
LNLNDAERDHEKASSFGMLSTICMLTGVVMSSAVGK